MLVLRSETERPEAVEAGSALLIGTETGAIVRAVESLWDDPATYARHARAINPFGDGHASERIAGALLERLRTLSGGGAEGTAGWSWSPGATGSPPGERP